MRPRPHAPVKVKRPETPEKLFTQVIDASQTKILKLWEEGDRFFPKGGVNCPAEIVHDNSVGRSYYQCNPHFWQCYWQNGVTQNPSLEVELFGQTFHVIAKAAFNPVTTISPAPRFYEYFKRQGQGIDLSYGYQIEVSVKEIPGLSQSMLLTDTCRDTYLPERIYGYGKTTSPKDDGFIWDNFGRKIFIDKFYVTNRQVNEWKILKGEGQKIVSERRDWPKPALLSLRDQQDYCAFYGKRLLEAKLFDAASMSPSDLREAKPLRVLRPDTPWQRDLGRSFLGTARINPDYQLTPLDCQLAQVQGCHERFFSTDSATWMGFHYSLGFYPESLRNSIEPDKNLKPSSRFHLPASPWHELGVLSKWDGQQTDKLPVAFRCFEEVAQ